MRVGKVLTCSIVFLRKLEYFRGILFLTSNRMRFIDVAFQSRISIGVSFEHMDSDTRRQIWLNFFGRFHSSNREARKELTNQIDVIQRWELNGRQIRNILRLAESLAFAEEQRRGTLRFRHVERIATETLNFQRNFQDEASKPLSQLERVGDHTWHDKRAARSHQPSGYGAAHNYGD